MKYELQISWLAFTTVLMVLVFLDHWLKHLFKYLYKRMSHPTKKGKV